MRKLTRIGVALLLSAVGCGGSTTTVTGNVTYNGAPVEEGTISFRPADGSGQVFAAAVKNGAYSVPTAQPGSRMVIIRGTRKLRSVGSSEEAMRVANEAAAKGEAWAGHLSEPADYIPEDAEGNSQTIEVKSGDQVINFDVKGPPREQ